MYKHQVLQVSRSADSERAKSSKARPQPRPEVESARFDMVSTTSFSYASSSNADVLNKMSMGG